MEICWPCWNSRESWVCYDGFPQNPLVRHNFPTFSPLKLQVFHLCPIFSQFFSDVFNMFTIDIAMFPSFPLLLQYFPCWNGSFFHLCPRSSHTSSYFYIIYICMYIISIYIHIYFYILYIYIHTYIYFSCVSRLYLAHWTAFGPTDFRRFPLGSRVHLLQLLIPGPITDEPVRIYMRSVQQASSETVVFLTGWWFGTWLKYFPQ